MSGEVRLRTERALPRVRGASPGEEQAVTAGREKKRREEGGLEVSGDGRYSPAGRRPSTEPLLRGAAGRERPLHVRSGGAGAAGAAAAAVGHAREAEAPLGGVALSERVWALAPASGDATNPHRGGKPGSGPTTALGWSVPSREVGFDLPAWCGILHVRSQCARSLYYY